VVLDDAGLNQILARLPESETVRGFVFNAVLAYVGETAGADAASGILGKLFKRKPIDLLKYPAADYFRLLHHGTVTIAPLVGAEVAMRELGKASALGFFESPMGRLLLSIIGTANPARLMSNCPTAYATSFSFGKRKYERTSETSLTLSHEEDPLPTEYNVGALEGALQAAKLTAQIDVEHLGQDAARYTLSW
jgi:uncharacterized protein (TIGR02265 family)